MNDIKSYKLKQDFTDHFPLLISINNLISENNNENYNKINYSKLRNIANTINWEQLQYMNDSNLAIEAIISEIQNCTNMAINNITNKNKNKPRKAWITKGIINSCKTKDTLYNLWKKDPNNENLKNDFKNFARILKTLIKDAKFKYEKSIIEKNKQNTKRLWNYVNNKLGKEKKKKEKN